MTALSNGGEWDAFLEGGEVCLAVWERDATDAGDCVGLRMKPSEAVELARSIRSLLAQDLSARQEAERVSV